MRFDTTSSNLNFRLGRALTASPCFSGRRAILCDIIPDDGAGRATDRLICLTSGCSGYRDRNGSIHNTGAIDRESFGSSIDPIIPYTNTPAAKKRVPGSSFFHRDISMALVNHARHVLAAVDLRSMAANRLARRAAPEPEMVSATPMRTQAGSPAWSVPVALLTVWISHLESNKPCQKCCRIKLPNDAFDIA